MLISALGGQGGGVLADWLASAARLAEFPAQATSIPGVAQRTGATTYYFEIYPDKTSTQQPVFSLYPAAGAIDLLVSFEPTEAARALAGGFVGPETTLITAKKRIFSTAEKILPGDGTVALASVLQSLQECAGKFVLIDMAQAAKTAKCHPNAVMFGVMAAQDKLPFGVEVCREAIRGSGVAVEANLAGFEAGIQLSVSPIEEFSSQKENFASEPSVFASRVAALPSPIRKLAGHAVAHLCDYQNQAYAELFLTRLGKIVEIDSANHAYRMSNIVARRLGAWMAFEDIMRVAQLKIRCGRFSRIRQELGIAKDVPLTVHDYLKPGSEELWGMLPKAFIEKRPKLRSEGLALKLKTSSPIGFALMKLLASLRIWRPYTARFEREQQLISSWLEAVASSGTQDYDLACDIANLAIWARGYGDTRNRGFERLTDIIGDTRQRSTIDPTKVRESLVAARNDPCKEMTS